MCKPKSSPAPQQVAPAPAPAPAAPSAAIAQTTAVSPESTGSEEDAVTRAKRKGRNGLKIDLAMGGTGGGSGLNIPTG